MAGVRVRGVCRVTASKLGRREGGGATDKETVTQRCWERTKTDRWAVEQERRQVREMASKSDSQRQTRGNMDENSIRQGVRQIFRRGQKRGQTYRCVNEAGRACM